MQDALLAHSVDALVSRFYRAAISVPLAGFGEAALRDLSTVLPFDAALWATGAPESARTHGLRLFGLDSRLSRELEYKTNLDRFWAEIPEPRADALDVAELVSPKLLVGSAIGSGICRPLGLGRVLGARQRDARSKLHSVTVVFRADDGPRFDAGEQRALRHLTFHLINASALAYAVFLGAVGAPGTGESAALCDRFGVCYDAQPGFMPLLAETFPDWDGEALPFDLSGCIGRASVDVRGLQVLAEPAGDLICVRARRRGPMDLLTGREREIVASVCRGLSYKEVARPLGIAPSTVSNHIYRVFDKLGVSSRSELAKLAGRWPQLH